MDIKPVLLKRRSSTSMPPTGPQSRRASTAMGRSRATTAVPKQGNATAEGDFKSSTISVEITSLDASKDTLARRTLTAPAKAKKEEDSRAKTSPKELNGSIGGLNKVKTFRGMGFSPKEGASRTTSIVEQGKANDPLMQNGLNIPSMASKVEMFEAAKTSSATARIENTPAVAAMPVDNAENFASSRNVNVEANSNRTPLIREDMFTFAPTTISESKEYRVRGDFLRKLLRYFPSTQQRPRALSADSFSYKQKRRKPQNVRRRMNSYVPPSYSYEQAPNYYHAYASDSEYWRSNSDMCSLYDCSSTEYLTSDGDIKRENDFVRDGHGRRRGNVKTDVDRRRERQNLERDYEFRRSVASSPSEGESYNRRGRFPFADSYSKQRGYDEAEFENFPYEHSDAYDGFNDDYLYSPASDSFEPAQNRNPDYFEDYSREDITQALKSIRNRDERRNERQQHFNYRGDDQYRDPGPAQTEHISTSRKVPPGRVISYHMTLTLYYSFE
ncbi:hypothetical protein BC829DRAFT_41041 [Chytridium lagenaria]|nr:hypothetical protein BC829DRAFT_41041 [Chytridium lagenaria]